MEDIKTATEYARKLIGKPYSWWKDGMELNNNKEPAYAINGKPPEIKDITGIFCAGIGNLILRHKGLKVPENKFDKIYNGGIQAWYDTYGSKLKPFNQKDVEEGDVVLAPYVSVENQGHWAYITKKDNTAFVLQSFAYDIWTTEPGVTEEYTLEQSHKAYPYKHILKSSDWLK